MRRLLNFPASRGTALRSRNRWRGRPRVEELEARTVLSVFTPTQISQAYGFNQIAFSANGKTVPGDGSGQTIAIVAAYNDANIQADLHHFDQTFNLPDPHFTKATPQGVPNASAGWALETSLDVEWAHAVAPGANILLVEANSASLSDLLGAVDYARKQDGVVAVSMSWGGSEFSNESSFDNYFTTPVGHLGGSAGLSGSTDLPGGVTFVAAAGDNPGTLWPSVSPNVVAVGGTSLKITNNLGTYGSETAWSHSGGGSSAFESEPAYQQSVQSTGQRTTPDVAYNANPNTGVSVYDSVGKGGWYTVGGTSAAAPQWAGLVAIADQGRALAGKGSLNGSTQTLYALYSAAQSSGSADFHMIGGSYTTSTGLGTPQANHLVQALVNVSGSGRTLTITTPTITKTITTATTTPGPVQTKKTPTATQTPQATTGDKDDSSSTTITNSNNTTVTVLVVIPTPPVFFPNNAHARIIVPAVTLPPTDFTPPPASTSNSLILSLTQEGSGGGDNYVLGVPATSGDNSNGPPAPAPDATPVKPPKAPKDPSHEGPSASTWRSATDLYFAGGLISDADEGAGDTLQIPSAILEPGAVAATLAFLLGGFWRGRMIRLPEDEKKPRLPE